METLKAINSRCSIRKFKIGEKVSDDVIKKILEAGMNAPSAVNAQNWEFIVIDDRNLLDKIPEFSPYAKMTKDCMIGILVCGDALGKYPEFWQVNCSAACENILLAIHDLGFGGCWTDASKDDSASGFKKLLNLPENIRPLAFIPVGHPVEIPKKVSRYEEKKVHNNKW